MKGAIISVKRTPEGLIVVLSHRKHDFYKALHNDDLVELAEIYGFVEEPISAVQKVWPKFHKPITRSWKAISRTRIWDGDLLYHVLTVLVGTIPVFPKTDLRLSMLDLETEQPVPKKTAANPRGLRTAKGKKKKSKSLPEIDLRPYLCDPKNISAILYKLKPFWQDTVRRLQKTNSNIFLSGKNPAFTVEPYLAFRHTGSGQVKRTKLPQSFVQYLLFRLWYLPWQNVKPFLSLYHELNLERDEILLGVVSRLLAFSTPEKALVWLKATRDMPAAKRYSFLLTLLETDAYDLDFTKYPPEKIRDLCAMIPYDCLERRLEEMFWTFNQKVSIPYLKGGYRLAKKYGWYRTLELQKDCSHYPAQDVENFIQWLKPDKSNLPFDIWEKFGREKNWKSVILRPQWKQWSPTIAQKYIGLLYNWMDYQRSGKIKMRDFLRFLDTVDTALQSVGKKYQSDLLHNLEEFLWLWNKEGEFDKHLPRSCALLIRLAKTAIPYSNMSLHSPLIWFIEHLSKSQYERLLRAPDSCFVNLDKTCQTENKRRLIARGLYILSSELPDFLIKAFTCFPGKLCRMARRLGTLRFAPRLKAAKQFSRHQLLKADLEKISPLQLLRLVEKYYQPGMTHPVPKKLQAHFKGEIELNEVRIRRYQEKSKTHFLSFMLDILDRKVLQELSKAYPVNRKSENWEHALQFFNWVDLNRRGFKNWFKAYLGGDNHYIENHPETQKWFLKHKKINKELWSQGILFCRRTEKHGPVRIELENDPLEILKMGTYVGSCLSLGGSYAYSAVAVLLDLNKQVLYARDTSGKVLGRQLVAISEKDELVCFDVYPESARNDIKNLFFEYDIDFAKALDIDLYEGDFSKHEDGYPVQRILSSEWWNDGAWCKIAPID